MRDGIFSHAGAVTVGLCVGILTGYGLLTPSMYHLRAEADNAIRERNAAVEAATNCHAEASPTAQTERIDELTIGLAAAKKQNAALQARFDTLAHQTGELISRTSADAQAANVVRENQNFATVLYEPAPPGQLQTVAQAVLILAGKNIQLPAMGKMVPRWYIPGKIAPTAYIERGAGFDSQHAYIWVDAHGGHEGPFRAVEYPQ